MGQPELSNLQQTKPRYPRTLEEAVEEKTQDEAEEDSLKRTLEDSEQAAAQPAKKIRALTTHSKPTIHLLHKPNQL